jgi:hypothetical protein
MTNAEIDVAAEVTSPHRTVPAPIATPVHWLRTAVGVSAGMVTRTVAYAVHFSMAHSVVEVGNVALRMMPGQEPQAASHQLEATVAAILEEMDVPRKEDIEQLSDKIGELNAAILALTTERNAGAENEAVKGEAGKSEMRASPASGTQAGG